MMRIPMPYPSLVIEIANPQKHTNNYLLLAEIYVEHTHGWEIKDCVYHGPRISKPGTALCYPARSKTYVQVGNIEETETHRDQLRIAGGGAVSHAVGWDLFIYLYLKIQLAQCEEAL